MDGQYNERAVEWSVQIPPIMRGLAFNPPLVMPYVGSMFKSDTAMLRPGTRYVQDLPPHGDDCLSLLIRALVAWPRLMQRRQAFTFPPALVPAER